MSRDATEIAVDIVVDNYNYRDFLPQAIAGARAQTHPRVDVIVVDDGSTDGSRELLAELSEEITVVLKENGGQASALNAGFERCRGDVVMFLDADDALKPHAAATVAAAFAAAEPPAKVQFRMDVIDAAGRPTGEVKPFPHLPMPSGDLRGAELAYSFDLGWMPTSANAFSADVLSRIMPIPEASFPILADWYLTHTATLLGPVLSLDGICASYRVHGANNFEHEDPRLDLEHVRRSVRLAQPTTAALERLADELGLERPERVTSVADLGQRLISLRLEPGLHPLPADGVGSHMREASRAIRRRSDVSTAMKAAYLAWFAAMAAAPRKQAEALAMLFLFPERRSAVNRLLGGLHRGG